MKAIFVVVVVAVCIFSCDCVLGVDVSQLYPTSTWECIKKAGYNYAIPRGFCSFGGLDHNAVQSLTNAKNAGLQTDVYMFPCRGKSPTTQGDEMVNGIPSHLYGTIWIDVETNPSSGCSWSGHDSTSNCQFLTELVNHLKSKGKNVGIYASYYMWQSIFGSHTACTGLSSHLLWYAHYDGKESFGDFQAFGGWTHPHMKQYQGTSSICGAGVDKNYHA